MGLRLTSTESAREMLDAWFTTKADPGEEPNVAALETAARPSHLDARGPADHVARGED
jgi:hypothetical protein